MPLEKRPLKPLGRDRVPPGGTPYKVKTDDDLGTVARAHGVTEELLVDFNFGTRDPSEINWYLRVSVGCRLPTRDGKNWMFTSAARPGIIYIPPKWHRPSFPPKPVEVSPARPANHKSGLWFGVGAVEGGTLGIAGKETVEACVYSWDKYTHHFWLNVDAWRLGIGVGASVGIVLVVATGVETPHDLEGFVVVGDTDFQLALAGKWGDVAKAAKGLNVVRKVAKLGKFIDKTISYAEWEKLRDFVWNLYKAMDIDAKKTALNVFGIPGAGVGLEASVYKSVGSVFVHGVSIDG
jgi:hypothetical protein